jgi:hypothetical protein
MTVVASDVARSFTRALAACQRRRLPRRPLAPVFGAWRSTVAFTRGTPTIFARTSRPPHGSRRASAPHAYARLKLH